MTRTQLIPLCLQSLLTCVPAGCATQQATGEMMTAVGVAAVLIASAAADDADCPEAPAGERPYECHAVDDKDKEAAAVVAAAGMGVALVGQALQHDGVDTPKPKIQLTPKRGSAWRLTRPPGFHPDPAVAENGAEPLSAAKLEAVTFAIEGVSCASCAAGIRRALLKHAGVIEVLDGADIHHLSVKYDRKKTDPAQLIRVIDQAGFKARVVN